MPSATILGYGRMGREHEKAYQEMGVRVEVLCDKPVNWRRSIGRTDYLSICSPDFAHAEQVIAGLHAGQAVFCEKPLCLTFAELGHIMSIPGRLGINYPLRHHKEWEDHPGDAGVWTYHWGRAHKTKESWRAQMTNYSPTLAGGCHLVDHFLYITGGEIVPYAGYRPHPLLQICDFYTGGSAWKLICDLLSDDDDHYHRIGRNLNRSPTDKTICLKRFIEGEDTRDICLEGMRVCLEMDRLSQESISVNPR